MSSPAPSATEPLLDEIRRLSDMIDKALSRHSERDKVTLQALGHVLQMRLERLVELDRRVVAAQRRRAAAPHVPDAIAAP
jgi:hypothetical protein